MEILRKECRSLWRKISLHVKNSCIFIDNHSAECLHWCGGADLLFEAGAESIKEFSSFESGKPNQTKAVFILSSPLVGVTETIIEDIIKSSRFNECIVVTSLDSQAHLYAAGKEASNDDFFQIFRAKMFEWIGCDTTGVEVVYHPIFLAPVLDNVFVTPSFDALFPVQTKDLSHLELQGNHPPTSFQDLHLYMFPREYRTLVKMLASSFRGLSNNLACKEEIFAVGPTSRLLSIQLSNVSNQAKASYPNKLGILFIDRTLDMMGPVSHSNRTLVDQVLGILPGLPGHYNNIAIDMSLLCSAKCEKFDDNIVYSGCLVPDTKDCPLLSPCAKKKPTDAVHFIQNQLTNAINEEGLDEDLELEVCDDDQGKSLGTLASAFKGNPGGILYNSALLQFSLAISQLLDNPKLEGWETLATEEKLILQQLGDEMDAGIVRCLERLADTKSIDFEEFCAVLIYASRALQGQVDSQIYERLTEIALKSLSSMDYEDLSENFVSLYELTEEDMKNSSRLTSIIYRIMNMVSEMKVPELQHFSALRLSGIEPPSHHPLLPQIVNRIFDTSKPELEPDVEHVTTGRKDILKMGISMFRKITPPRPNDFPLLIIYIIGGVTTTEVAQINKELQKYPDSNCEVVIGSTRLVSPTDIVDKALFCRNMHPDV